MDVRRNLAIDLVALAVYLLAANPWLTGIGAHEWLGLGLAAVFFAHVLAHAGWVAEAARATLASPSRAPARSGNLALDVLVMAAFAVCTVSGLLVSGAVLPAFGLYAPGIISGTRCTPSRRRRCSRCCWYTSWRTRGGS